MHADLDALVYYSLRQAKKGLEKGDKPFFAAVLDKGEPTLLNPVIDPEYELPSSTAGKVEFLRSLIRQYPDVTGGLFCAPALAPTDTGLTLDALKLHFQHVDDAVAYTIVLPYSRDDLRKLELLRPAWEESDDLIFPR